MFLSETWLQKKGWKRVKRSLPKGYIWEMQEAEKRSKKGRAMGEWLWEGGRGLRWKEKLRKGRKGSKDGENEFRGGRGGD